MQAADGIRFGHVTRVQACALAIASSVLLGAALTNGGTFSPATVTFTGSNQMISAGGGYKNVVVTGTGLGERGVRKRGRFGVEMGCLEKKVQKVMVRGNLWTSNDER